MPAVDMTEHDDEWIAMSRAKIGIIGILTLLFFEIPVVLLVVNCIGRALLLLARCEWNENQKIDIDATYRVGLF